MLSGPSSGPLWESSCGPLTAFASPVTELNIPTETWIDADAVLADLPAARELVNAAGKAIGHLTVFVP